MLGSAESEDPMLTNREIIFERSIPTCVITVPERYGETEWRTTCRSSTALCVASRDKNQKNGDIEKTQKMNVLFGWLIDWAWFYVCANTI